jgi:hypothetical protein
VSEELHGEMDGPGVIVRMEYASGDTVEAFGPFRDEKEAWEERALQDEHSYLYEAVPLTAKDAGGRQTGCQD